MPNNLTQGSVAKNLLRFTVPLIFSGLLQQLFNWADAFIVGNIEGELALGAIGATTSLYNLFLTVIIGFTSGLSVMAAQRFGRGEEESLRDILKTFVLVLGIGFLLIALVGILATGWILQIMGTPESIFLMSRNYFQIILVGIPFLAIYNTYSAVLRGLGDSNAPFVSVLISSFVNVGLDLYLVGACGLGVRGAALATVGSQIAMTLVIIVYTLRRHDILRFSIRGFSAHSGILQGGFRYGFPPAIQSCASSLGSVFLQSFMNTFGAQTVAAITTAYRVDTLILLPVINLSSGIATMVAQNYGAGKKERTGQVLKVGMGMEVVTSLVLSSIVIYFGGSLIAMFGLTPEAVEIGKNFFFSIGQFYVVFGLCNGMRGYFEGMGKMVFSGAVSIIALLLRIFLSYALVSYYDNMVIAYAEAYSWIFLCLVLVGRYVMLRRKSSVKLQSE